WKPPTASAAGCPFLNWSNCSDNVLGCSTFPCDLPCVHACCAIWRSGGSLRTQLLPAEGTDRRRFKVSAGFFGPETAYSRRLRRFHLQAARSLRARFLSVLHRNRSRR